MKHRIVHTLQKYVLNPPIKLALVVGLPLPGYALLETKGRKEDGEATAHSGRAWTYRQPVLAGRFRLVTDQPVHAVAFTRKGAWSQERKVAMSTARAASCTEARAVCGICLGRNDGMCRSGM
jgi:hypothetical protein